MTLMQSSDPVDSTPLDHLWPAGGVGLLSGSNFSGRTKYLHEVTRYGQSPAADRARRVYIGPEVYNVISGLAPTVRTELALHDRLGFGQEQMRKLLDAFGLTELLDRNPFTLSGGEQVCLVTAAKVLLGPDVMALDCVFEQLHEERRGMLLDAFRGLGQRFLGLVADNRLEDFDAGFWTKTVDVAAVLEEVPLPPPIRCPRVGPFHSLPNIEGCHVKLDGVRFAYGRKVVLAGLDAELQPGKVYTLGGNNGAGKSTLAKILTGVLRLGGGCIMSNGLRIRPERVKGRLVSYHFQNPDLQLFSSSVSSELASSSAGDRARVETVIEAFDLGPVLDKHPLDLPFVVRKRVALAATLAAPAPWLILDEPTLGQDREAAIALRDIIDALAAKGHGIIVISHSRWFRDHLASESTLVLENGRFGTAS